VVETDLPRTGTVQVRKLIWKGSRSLLDVKCFSHICWKSFENYENIAIEVRYKNIQIALWNIQNISIINRDVCDIRRRV